MRRVVVMAWVVVGAVGGASCIGPDPATEIAPLPRVAGVAMAYGVRPTVARPTVAHLGAVAVGGPHAKAKLKLVLKPVAATHAENGHGVRVGATDPVALQVEGRLPVRALDPVLHVGALHFRTYSYPDKNVLRFVVADRALLPAGAVVYLQWGADAASRVVLVRALEVPK